MIVCDNRPGYLLTKVYVLVDDHVIPAARPSDRCPPTTLKSIEALTDHGCCTVRSLLARDGLLLREGADSPIVYCQGIC